MAGNFNRNTANAALLKAFKKGAIFYRTFTILFEGNRGGVSRCKCVGTRIGH